MIKTCTKCGLEKEHKIRKDRGNVPQSHCVECQAAYRKEHYQKNKQKYVDKAKKWGNDRKEEVRRVKEESPCADCKEYYPFYVMQFDHLDDKEFNISQCWTYGKDRVMAEIAKCEIVCANCHAKRTYQRQLAALT